MYFVSRSSSRTRTKSYDSNHSLDSSFSIPSICHNPRYRDSYLPPRPASPPLYESRYQPPPPVLMMRYKIARALRLIPERRRGGKQTMVLRPEQPYSQPQMRREGWRSTVHPRGEANTSLVVRLTQDEFRNRPVPPSPAGCTAWLSDDSFMLDAHHAHAHHDTL